ncbi:MAG: hypothetical protein N2482_02230 [Patescibacteria group bacterium]|nr:hypothetical protein [Patescibacteria group bacterium]
MLPIVVIFKQEKELERYLKKYLEQEKYPSGLIFEVRPLKEEISINQIREIKRELMVNSTKKRVIIFFNFDKATFEAQNALLKTLEENVNNNQFILTVNNIEKVLPTIRSRSKTVFLIEDKSQFSKKKQDNDFLKKITSSSLPYFLKETISNKNEALKVMEQVLFTFYLELKNNHSIIEKNKAGNVLKKTLFLKRLLEENNLNSQLTIDNLLIYIWELYSIEN